MRTPRGVFRLARIRGVRIELHWSFPLGALATAFLLPLWVALTLTVIVHELGHIAMAKLFRLPILGIQLSALGGKCSYEGATSEVRRALIAWGGVLAQGVLCAVCAVVQAITHLRGSAGGRNSGSSCGTSSAWKPWP